MKRPWLVCLLFALCLASVLTAMGWLTVKALQLDRAELAARRQAELEEKVSLALWRMDTLLAPLLAQEAARPHFVYRSFLNGDLGKASPVPSPLLVEPPEHVYLNFQWSPSSQWTSPQVPSDLQSQLAIENGASVESIKSNSDRLEQLRQDVDERELLTLLPTANLPLIESTLGPWAGHVKLNDSPSSVIDNTIDGRNWQTDTPQSVATAPDPSASTDTDPPQNELDRTDVDRDGQEAQATPPPTPRQRGGREWNRRNQFYQSYAQQAVVQQRAVPQALESKQIAREGISRPIWVKSHLLLARRVTVGDEVRLLGSWLDWPQLRRLLLSELTELLPHADVQPAASSDAPGYAGRMLATLPVELVVPTPTVNPNSFSPLRTSLWVAWACLLMATAAIVVLLTGVVALSERRGAFVSAVTHELRTPLTTFRMYAEMLAEGMVPDEPTRKHYLDTLRTEADRLAHLVENVLSYARLEKGRVAGPREMVQVDQLLQRILGRLCQRAAQADMQLIVDAPEPTRQAALRTDAAALEQILLNLVDNACKYASSAKDRRIDLQVARTDRHVRFRVRDHGPGLSRDAAARLFRPFSKSSLDAARSAPGVGLGLALCRRLARQLGARLKWESDYPDGASFVLLVPIVRGSTGHHRYTDSVTTNGSR